MKKNILMIMMCLSFFKSNSQISNYEYSRILLTNIIEVDLYSKIANINEIIDYQRDKVDDSNFLLRVDTVIFISNDDLKRGFVRFHLIGTNYTMIYYADAVSHSSYLISYGYEGEQKLYFKGWKKFLKSNKVLFSKLTKERKQDLFMDILIPSNYTIYRQRVNQSFYNIKRGFSTQMNTNIELQYKVSNNYKDKCIFIVTNNSSGKIIQLELIGNKENFVVKFIDDKGKSNRISQDLFGYSNNYFGKRVILLINK